MESILETSDEKGRVMRTANRETRISRQMLFAGLLVGSSLILATSAASLHAGRSNLGRTARSNAIPSSLPRTRSLDRELADLSSRARTAEKWVKWLQSEVRTTRRQVKSAARVAASIRAMDRRLETLIRRLKTYVYVPNVRTFVKPLIRNLQTLRTTIHKLRKKTDYAEKSVLRPLSRRLKKFEIELRKPIATLASIRSKADKARSALARAARFAVNNVTARHALEQSAREVRPVVYSLSKTIYEFNKQASAAGRKFSSARKNLAAFWTVEKSLNTMSRQMRPGENVARDLDRVMSKRISIKLPGRRSKRVGFTIRQILTAPGKVLDIVLKPLEKIAHRMLQPVLKKLNIRIKPPKGIRELAVALKNLPRVTTDLKRTMSQVESKARRDLSLAADHFTRILQQRVLNGSARG